MFLTRFLIAAFRPLLRFPHRSISFQPNFLVDDYGGDDFQAEGDNVSSLPSQLPILVQPPLPAPDSGATSSPNSRFWCLILV